MFNNKDQTQTPKRPFYLEYPAKIARPHAIINAFKNHKIQSVRYDGRTFTTLAQFEEYLTQNSGSWKKN